MCGSSAFREVFAPTREEGGLGKNDMEIQLYRVHQGLIIAKKTSYVLLVAHLFASLNVHLVHLRSVFLGSIFLSSEFIGIYHFLISVLIVTGCHRYGSILTCWFHWCKMSLDVTRS